MTIKKVKKQKVYIVQETIIPANTDPDTMSIFSSNQKCLDYLAVNEYSIGINPGDNLDEKILINIFVNTIY